MANVSKDGDISQIIVAVIVGAIWLFNAVTAMAKKAQKKPDKTEEQTNSPSVAQTPLTEADKRYREVQEEIRRRIAQRSSPSAPSAPVQAPAPAAYVPSKTALPPIGNPYMPRRMAPKPQPTPVPMATPAVDDNDDSRISMPAQPSQPWGQNLMETTRASDVRAVMARPQDEAAAYAQTDDKAQQPGAVLRAALSVPGAARQAFLFREIFDRPLCLRPGPGGHEVFDF